MRGHAPRAAGAKMVIAEDEIFGTIGGGNLEATAIDRARALLTLGATDPDLLVLTLSEKAPAKHGVQCCGGEVTMLLEPLRATPSVAVFGIGHVGLELARILARHNLDLHLIDSRPEMLTATRIGEPGRSGMPADAVASVHLVQSVIPEAALSDLPTGTHVLVMTHDHAEDLAVVDQCLRTGGFGSIGLIGSAPKWSRFRKKLRQLGHTEEALARVSTPIGLPQISGKQPAVIALSVAADVLQRLQDPVS